jgi:ATP-dependent RNA helicase DDX56/DBP9
MESDDVVVNETLLDTLLDTKHVFSSCEFGLDTRLMKAIARMQFIYATLALQGKDLLARARTGSGETAALSLSLIHKYLF